MLDNSENAHEGIRLGNYRIQDQIGRGGMGTVYRAEHTTLGTHVAIKVLSPRFATDPAFVARFEREARAAAALSHPNIVRVFDAGDDDGLHYIVMEFVDGQTLADVLAVKGKLDVPRALLILKDIASALVHAHARQIIHRDITPGNIMITPDGQVKLADMGLAKQMGSQLPTGATETGATVGTPYYMSPEQVVDSKSVDPRTDLYSLGATFYHLVTGKRPFDGGSAYEIMRRVETEDPVPLHRLEPGIPRDVCRLVERLMVKNRQDRYRSAQELLEDVQRLEAGGHIAKHRKRLRAFRPAGSARKHWKNVVIAGGSAAVAAAAVIIGFLLRYRPETIVVEMPRAISVSASATPDATAKIPESKGFKTPWPVVLPSAPVEVETTSDGFVFAAGESRMVISTDGLTLKMTGIPLITGDFARLESPGGGTIAGKQIHTLDETSAGTILETTLAFGPSAPSVTRRILFSERTLLVEWECDSRTGHPDVGIQLNTSVLPNGSHATAGGAAESPPDEVISVLVEGGGYSFPEDSRLRAFVSAGASPEDIAVPTRTRALVTSIPVIRQETYAARLDSGQLTVSLPGRATIVSDDFMLPGGVPSGAVPTGYYRSEDGAAIGYRFLLPTNENGATVPLIKSLLFTATRVQIEWLWDTEAGQASFQLDPSTVLGRNFIAKLADDQSEGGVLSSATTLENVHALLVDLGDRTVSFMGRGADYAFDGEHVRLVHTAPVEPGKPRTGKLVIEFAQPSANE